MAQIDPNLIRRVTQEVIESMRQRDNRQRPMSTSIQPAIGVCTGDYSQFTDRPDLPGQSEPRASQPSANPPPNTQRQPSTQALIGIITAQQLEDAIDAAPDHVAVLAIDARLTPLAHDLARERPNAVCREEPSKISAKRTQANPTSNPAQSNWLWWAEEHQSEVINTVNALSATLVRSGAARSDAGLTQAIGDLDDGVTSGTLRGGLLFVRSAAQATVLANRCRALRAVVPTCPEAVDQAIHQVGANVLIVEYPYQRGETLRQMVETFVNRRPNVPAILRRQLDQLGGNEP